jgi:hypothetical protein
VEAGDSEGHLRSLIGDNGGDSGLILGKVVIFSLD